MEQKEGGAEGLGFIKDMAHAQRKNGTVSHLAVSLLGEGLGRTWFWNVGGSLVTYTKVSLR